MANTYLQDVNAKVKDGDLTEAVELLWQALEKHDGFFLYHEVLGDLYALDKQRLKACQCYERALIANPRAEWINVKVNRVIGDSSDFCGVYDFYPDRTGQRKAEGGWRTRDVFKSAQPDFPLVTIVTAVYDNQFSLQRCIDSVTSQTYPNIEYVVIDGGSPDSTLEIINSNETAIDYFLSEPDGGIYGAMNKGIRLARGDYICLLNSDDYYDSEFVSEAINVAQNNDSGVVYTDYFADGKLLVAQRMGVGVLFGHLNICHNSFLVSKGCYNEVGAYYESFTIVSDAVWIRRAFKAEVQFDKISKPLFTLTSGGASSGDTEERRQRFIREAGQSYRINFPALTAADAQELYLFRFNKKRVNSVSRIAARYIGKDPEIKAALGAYVEHCFRDRDNFCLGRAAADADFVAMGELVDLLGADEKTISIDTKRGQLPDVLSRIDDVISKRKKNPVKTILHFVTVFSAPSETFIYDLIKRLDEKTGFDNFVLFEHTKLEDARPYNKAIHVPWGDFRTEVAERIYKYLLAKVAPDVVFGHFAINAHKFEKKIRPLGLRFPMVVMTHGIDVFKLKKQSEYTAYVINDLAKRSDVQFTAVSNYLRSELLSAGVPGAKVSVVHNSVNQQFHACRKTHDFFDGVRPLRLLSIGRLIKWKGHRFLIEALYKFSKELSQSFELTIVYGGDDQQLDNLRGQAEQLGLTRNVHFEPFVDFNEDRSYLSHFDCFVHPSTYADDVTARSETFGVAILEAIAAGLPVITSDAGGLAEVVGYNSTHSRIVPHGDSGAICAALVAFCKTREAFSDNGHFAQERLKAFAPESQLAKLANLVCRATSSPLRAALFSTSTVQGAGYAAFRLHKGLEKTLVASRLFTTVRNHGDQRGVKVLTHPSGNNKNWSSRQPAPKPGYTIFTLNEDHGTRAELQRMVEDFDVINIHWFARLLSVQDIAALTHLDKPVVMTIRDMLPITGGCHYFHGCERWQSDCVECPQIPTGQMNLPAEVLKLKRATYNFDNLTLVTLSEHTRSIIKRVPYFNRCRIEVIPNSIETDTFRPYDKKWVRKELGLPADRRIIGYAPSYSSEVKGYREILAAFRRLGEVNPELDPFILLMGNTTPATEKIGFDKKALGYISDNDALARAYSACDVVVVPSLEETFSNTTAEAIACGVPVVGFKTGAVPEMAIDGKTGYTYVVGDVEGLADGVERVLNGPDLSANCRRHAEAVLAFDMQARRYENLFYELVANTARRER